MQYWPQKKDFNLKSNWDHKLFIVESYFEIRPQVLELKPKKQGNELSDNLLEFYKDLLFLLLCY